MSDRTRSCHPEAASPTIAAAAPPRPDPERLLAECSLEFVRAGGPGGQHRNRRETGVRLTHLPTGLVVMATERRSQAQNRSLALERMVERLERRARVRKPRRATRKPRGVKAREREVKRLRSRRKAERRRPRADE